MQSIFYIVYIAKFLKKRNIGLFTQSKTKKSELNSWLKWLVKSFSLVILIQMCIFIVCNVFTQIEICIVFTGIFFIISFIIVNSIVLIGLSKPKIFKVNEKYISSSLKKEIKNEYLEKLKLTQLENPNL